MRIIPVLDVLKGRVVRGIAGQRDSYQPIQSILTPNADVRSVCTAFRQQFGISEYYIADLDGIERGEHRTTSTLQNGTAPPHWNENALVATNVTTNFSRVVLIYLVYGRRRKKFNPFT